jgi:phosphoribosylaminoimidazole-succinocarboxamide synthase
MKTMLYKFFKEIDQGDQDIDEIGKIVAQIYQCPENLYQNCGFLLINSKNTAYIVLNCRGICIPMIRT